MRTVEVSEKSFETLQLLADQDCVLVDDVVSRLISKARDEYDAQFVTEKVADGAPWNDKKWATSNIPEKFQSLAKEKYGIDLLWDSLVEGEILWTYKGEVTEDNRKYVSALCNKILEEV